MAQLTSFSLMDEDRGRNLGSYRKIMTYSVVGLCVVHAGHEERQEEPARDDDGREQEATGRGHHDHERCRLCEDVEEPGRGRLGQRGDPVRKRPRLERDQEQEASAQNAFRCSLQELKVRVGISVTVCCCCYMGRKLGGDSHVR
jgi:hypothetical protein